MYQIYFNLEWYSTCFGLYFRQSSGVQDCAYSNRHMSNISLISNNTLHVSAGLSVHHQEFKTVHTATGTCQTDTAVCFLASRQHYLSDICLLLYVQSWTPDDGRKHRPKHVQCYSKLKKFETLVHLVGFTIEMYFLFLCEFVIKWEHFHKALLELCVMLEFLPNR
jgi:hypothetical protein